jgi:c-di-GMP-binding flagellar brake protein YcgR
MADQAADNQQLLTDAVARNAGIMLSIPSAGMDKHFKSRFLGETEQGVWIEVVAGSAEPLKELLSQQKPLDISFNNPTRVISFNTTAITFEEAHRINTDTAIPAMLIARPDQIKNVQRRGAYRVHVPRECELRIRVWVLTEHAHLNDRPMAAQEVKVELVDISIGGVGMRMPAPAEGQKQTRLIKDQRLRVELSYKEMKMLFDGRFRPAPLAAAGTVLTAGIVFKNLESDIEGRKKLGALTGIVGELQREEVRRNRLGLAS